MMHKYKEGDFGYYNCGSDSYPVQIIEVSHNGKTVRAVGIKYKLKPTNNKTQYLERQTVEDVEIIGTTSEILTFKSRQDQQHKEPGKYGLKLHPGFSSYRDPHV